MIPFCSQERLPCLSYIPFPSTLFHQLVFHPPSLHLAVYFLVYLSALLFPNSCIILFLGIPFSSILCTCPNQCNLLNLKFLYWLIFSNFLFHCHVLGLKFFYTLSFQKCLFAFCLSLLVFRFLMHMLQFCLLLCSNADHVFKNYCLHKIKTIHTQTV